MSSEDDFLIEKLKSLMHKGTFIVPGRSEYKWVNYHVNPPVTVADLTYAETLLGFTLPPFLKRVYMEVGNGGFGPGYGLVPLLPPTLFPEEDLDIDSIVRTTLYLRGEDWPATLLFICHWGCCIYASIDCSTPEYPLVRSEQNWHCGIEAPSLQNWLRTWLSGTPMFSINPRNLPPVSF